MDVPKVANIIPDTPTSASARSIRHFSPLLFAAVAMVILTAHLGQVGWTDRPDQDFANKDALGAAFEEESPTAGLEDPR